MSSRTNDERSFWVSEALIGGNGEEGRGEVTPAAAAAAAREVRSAGDLRGSAMEEDYEQELYGIEDDFHSQFAAELEVLAELEGGQSGISPTPYLPLGKPASQEDCGEVASLARALTVLRLLSLSPQGMRPCRLLRSLGPRWLRPR